ncbi:MAG TPA: FAD-dependent oxidoreductase, partial [Gammaproteobacteria bacterium]|nr:FAD-dependent oxidoreductase [Gammaproteobacteria bacterium]
AGYLNPRQLCVSLADAAKKKLHLITHTEILKLRKKEGYWQLIGEKNCLIAEGEKVILANGFDAQRLLDFNGLSLSRSRGQVDVVATQEKISGLKLPVCHDGYLLPEVAGSHLIGASYNFDEFSLELSVSDQVENINRSNRILYEKLGVEDTPLRGRASIRTTSMDHLPLVGPVPNEAAYLADYKNICHGQRHERYPAASYRSGLFITTGHGSRGLVSCFAAAAYLTSLIAGKPITLAKDVAHRLHPARFLIRSLKKRPGRR